jgi:hypothetical protein
MSGLQNAINVVKAIGGASILLSIRSGSEKYYARKKLSVDFSVKND